MRIENVIVCVNYSDFLAYSLPLNKSLFDRTLVVTSKNDKKTQRICEYHFVETFVTDAFTRNGQKFNKGAAINEALEYLNFQGWVVHMDADIILPPRTRNILENAALNEQFLYGADRVMVPSWEAWLQFFQNPLPQHELAYVHPGPFPVGTRLMKLEQGGWIPLGYFQMFHRQSQWLGKPYYPTNWDSAATSDLFFSFKWPRTHRHMLPEILAMHLATPDIARGEMGTNWEGRQTSFFGL